MTMEMTAICRVVLVFFAVVLSFNVCVMAASEVVNTEVEAASADSGTSCEGKSPPCSSTTSESSLSRSGADAGVGIGGVQNGTGHSSAPDNRPGGVGGVSTDGNADSTGRSDVGEAEDTAGTAPNGTSESGLGVTSRVDGKNGSLQATGGDPSGGSDVTQSVVSGPSGSAGHSESGSGKGAGVTSSGQSPLQEGVKQDESDTAAGVREKATNSELRNSSTTVAISGHNEGTTEGVQSVPVPKAKTEQGETTHGEGTTSSGPNANDNDATQNTQNNENDEGTTTITTSSPLETPSPGKDTTLSPSQDPQSLKDAGNVDSSDIPLWVSTPLVPLLLSLLYVAVCVER